MAPEIFTKIVATGLLRAMHPRNLGGAEYTAPQMLPLLEELARADGSTAWSFMVAAEMPALFQRFPEHVLSAIFKGGCDVSARAPLTPKPGTQRTSGGYRVSGRWPLASGSYEADWYIVGAFVTNEDGSPAVTPEGAPDLRLFLVPGEQVKPIDNWNSLGLRATQSHDVEIDGVFVADDYSAPFSHTSPVAHDIAEMPRLRRLSFYTSMGPTHLGVILGLARAMLDELIELAQTKRPFLNPMIVYRDDTLFQNKVGMLATRLSAARSFAVSASEEIWHYGNSEGVPPPFERAQYRAATAHVHSECAQIGTDIYALAGSAVLPNSSTLQRRFRDLRTASQHIMGSPEIFLPFGALTLNSDLPNAQNL
jgi:alkylation response protein AidB-like acyl-CoA dehydrogenase